MTPDSRGPSSGVPAGWSVLPLGKIVERCSIPIEVERDTYYREIGIRSHGKGVFHKEPVKGDTLGSKRVFEVVPDRLVFNIVFAWEGAVAVTSSAESGMIASHRFPMFGPTPESLADVEFLRRFFQTEAGVRLLGEASPGGAGRNRTLNQKFTAEIPVLLPPLAEQRKIAAILSSVDDAIEATQAVIDQLGIVKKAMMAELLTRGLPGRHTRFKHTEIGEVPEEWEVCRLGQLAEVAYGLTVNAHRRASGITRPYLTVASVQQDGFDLAAVKEIGVLPGDPSRYELRAGDLLLVEGNANPDRLGRAFVWMDEVRGAFHQNHLIRVRCVGVRVEPRWLAIAINSEAGRRQILDHAKTSSGLHTINSTVVAGIVVPVPEPDERRAMIEAYGRIEARLAVEREALAGLLTTKSALSSALLTGEVRVTPDPEPAQ